ncbi:MAG: hypothetical protein PHC46_02410 [Clostridia bacterium]|nr:hypothetical protein [Clostridia bacterium]
MKKNLILLLIFSIITIMLNRYAPYLAVSYEPEPIFARIKYNNVCLYKTPTDNSQNSNVYFLLEQSYFVQLLADENADFYSAKYIDLEGFVKKNQVETVTDAPNTPYLNDITFNTTPSSSVIMRTEPTSINADASALKILEPNSQGLMYYGKISGEEAVLGLGNIWFYSRFDSGQNNTTFGYVYAPFTNNLTPITPNIEVINLGLTDFNQMNEFLEIQPKFRFLIILLTAFPTIIALLLFFKNSIKNKRNKKIVKRNYEDS